eukprot:jgi/Tetstr1/436059/TSEL_024937.t1
MKVPLIVRGTATTSLRGLAGPPSMVGGLMKRLMTAYGDIVYGRPTQTTAMDPVLADVLPRSMGGRGTKISLATDDKAIKSDFDNDAGTSLVTIMYGLAHTMEAHVIGLMGGMGSLPMKERHPGMIPEPAEQLAEMAAENPSTASAACHAPTRVVGMDGWDECCGEYTAACGFIVNQWRKGRRRCIACQEADLTANIEQHEQRAAEDRVSRRRPGTTAQGRGAIALGDRPIGAEEEAAAAMSFLTWADLSEAALLDIVLLRDKRPNAPKSCREALARAVGLAPPSSPSRSRPGTGQLPLVVEGGEGEGAGVGGEEAAAALRVEIELDLLMDAIELCQSLQFDNAKTSTFFSLVRRLHARVVQGRLQVDVAFGVAKELLLTHSVHRPPFSIAVFSLADVKTLADWLLEHYFRHYKLIQYVFAPRVKVNVTSRHPSDIVERAPLFPSLDEAATEEQDQARKEEEAAAKAKEEAAAAEEAAAQAEREREERLQTEYLSAVPEELKAIVAAALETQLGGLRDEMGEQFKSQEEGLLAKIKELEGKVGK